MDKTKQKALAGFEEDKSEVGTTTAADRWLRELGVDAEALAHMMRKTTETRPFVYELRFDLIPVKAGLAVLVAKGFGADSPLVAFHNDVGFLALLRGFKTMLQAGKVKWYEDSYPPSNYEERRKMYIEGDYYRT